jgi:hypothetical protein
MFINAVLVEGRSVQEVCETHDISRCWLYELIARYREHGDDGLQPQSKRPRSSPTRCPAAVEDEIVALHKELTGLGVDAGAHTSHYLSASARSWLNPCQQLLVGVERRAEWHSSSSAWERVGM